MQNAVFWDITRYDPPKRRLALNGLHGVIFQKAVLFMDLRVFENRVLRRIFGPKRDEVTGGWRKLHNEKLHNLYPLHKYN
jgi:ABC-type transporter Mla maintaining outer membrane lipid asymmetry ATPase subunit MlaF